MTTTMYLDTQVDTCFKNILLEMASPLSISTRNNVDVQQQQPWYYHKMYRRYWEQYDRVMCWQQRHHEATLRAQSAALDVECTALRGYFSRSVMGGSFESTDVRHGHGHVVTKGPLLEDDYDDADSEDEEMEFEMEITDDLMKFLEKSEQHRRQLREERKLAESGQLEEETKCGPPTEHPGAKRTAEMKLLYGKQAAMIHGMETAVQLTFNRNSDYFQPKLWPNMPLRLQF